MGGMESRISAARARANRANNVILASAAALFVAAVGAARIAHPARASQPATSSSSERGLGVHELLGPALRRRVGRRRLLRLRLDRAVAVRAAALDRRLVNAHRVRLDGLRRRRRRRDRGGEARDRAPLRRPRADVQPLSAGQRAQPRQPRVAAASSRSRRRSPRWSSSRSAPRGRRTASSTRRSARRSRPPATTATSPS